MRAISQAALPGLVQIGGEKEREQRQNQGRQVLRWCDRVRFKSINVPGEFYIFLGWRLRYSSVIQAPRFLPSLHRAQWLCYAFYAGHPVELWQLNGCRLRTQPSRQSNRYLS